MVFLGNAYHLKACVYNRAIEHGHVATGRRDALAMRMIICCLLLSSSAFASVSTHDAVTYIDPVELKKWEWRADRAEKHLSKGLWVKADKAARGLGRDIIDGSRLGHRIEPLLARVSAIRAVSFAMRGRTRLARWHWQLAQILTSSPPPIDLSQFDSRISYLSDVKPRHADERPDGTMTYVEAGQPAPRALNTPMPIYSKQALRAGIQSRMVVNVVLGEDGRPSDPYVYDKSDLAVFYYPILIALVDWEFEPLLIDGQPRSFVYILTVRFGIE